MFQFQFHLSVRRVITDYHVLIYCLLHGTDYSSAITSTGRSSTWSLIRSQQLTAGTYQPNLHQKTSVTLTVGLWYYNDLVESRKMTMLYIVHFRRRTQLDLHPVFYWPYRVRYWWGRAPYFNQSEAVKHSFLASDWLKYWILPHQYRTLFIMKFILNH